MSIKILRIKSIVTIFLIFCFILKINRKVFAYYEQYDNDYVYYFDDNRSTFIRELSDEFTDTKTAEFVILGEKGSGMLCIGSNYIGIVFSGEIDGLNSYRTIALDESGEKGIRVIYIFDKELVVTKPFIEDWELSKDSQAMFLKTPLISDFKQKLLLCRSFKVKLEYKRSNSVVAKFDLDSFHNVHSIVLL